MRIPERVRDFLVHHKPNCDCDDCIQEQLRLSRRQEVATVTKTLGLTADFIRDSGLCDTFVHPRTKLVTHAL